MIWENVKTWHSCQCQLIEWRRVWMAWNPNHNARMCPTMPPMQLWMGANNATQIVQATVQGGTHCWIVLTRRRPDNRNTRPRASPNQEFQTLATRIVIRGDNSNGRIRHRSQFWHEGTNTSAIPWHWYCNTTDMTLQYHASANLEIDI